MMYQKEGINRDPDAFINEIDYNKELFSFIKARVDPNAKSVPKGSRLVANSPFRHFFVDKKKASVIICPDVKCREFSMEGEGSSLVGRFVKHLTVVHRLTPSSEFTQKLSNTISYIRDNNKIQYRDPFFHVDYENLLQNLSYSTERDK